MTTNTSAFCQKGNDLSDVSNANTSLQNLGVYSSVVYTITGNLQAPINIIFLRGFTRAVAGDTGAMTYTAINGPCIYDFTYAEVAQNFPISLNKITALSVNVAGIGNGGILITSCTTLTSVAFPNLVYVGGTVNMVSENAVTSF